MNKEQLQDIFRQSYSAEAWQELLIDLFGASEIRQTPSQLESDTNEKVNGFELGRLNTSDRYEIGLFAFEIKGGKNLQLNRVGLRSLVKSYTRYNVDAALVVYYDEAHWRLSFICDLRDQKTAPKRYTYVFGNPHESYRTASAMLAKLSNGSKPTFEDIKAAFSVEALSKDFFKGYKAQYAKFCDLIGGTEKWQRDYVKKMMGRLVFLQFLQKKGWMGCEAAQADWTGGDLQYTQNLIKRYEDNKRLLSDVLEPLFFDTLNTKRNGDIADPILGDKIKIPYLNGGLFDKDILDERDIDFPYAYFAELMDFFSQYNFTIDENDPNDAEVGIDPEMLGHIFENLLEDNKDKGAFYTPKEIVQYMCRQSLIEYLQSKLGKHTEIANFINNHDTGNRTDKNNFIAQNAREIERLLDCVKVCDPAIGSGAFPMGVLNEIFHAKMALDMTLDRAAVKKSIIQNSIYGVDIEQGAVDIARLRFWLSLVVDEDEPQPLPNLDYKIMCGNSLLSRYALDMPFEDVFKEYNKGKNASDKMSLDRYKQLVADYTNTSDHTQKAGFRNTIEEIKSAFRTELSRGEKEKFAKLKGQIADLETPLLFGERTKTEKEDLKKYKIKFAKQEQEQADIVNNRLYENAFEWRFEFPQLLDDDGNFVGFDIVIGNPPYGFRNVLTAEDKAYFRKIERIEFPSGDSAELFIKKCFDRLVKENGLLSFIVPKKSLYGDAWETTRINYWGKYDLCFILDTGKSFEDVLLEASAFGLKKSKPTGSVSLAFLKDNKEIEAFNSVPFVKILNNANTLQIYSVLYGEEMLAKIVAKSKIGDSGVEGKLGLAIGTDFYSDDPKEYKLLKGIDVGRYKLKGSRFLNNQDKLNWSAANEFLIPKVLCQRLVAHIQNPKPHLKFAACFDEEGVLITNTIMSFTLPDSIKPKFFVAYLNSKFLAWYAYNFVYSRAIRGMDLYNFYIQQLPIPLITSDEQQPFIALVDKISEAKANDHKANTTALENQIDQMVYALYDLTEDEIKIIEK